MRQNPKPSDVSHLWHGFATLKVHLLNLRVNNHVVNGPLKHITPYGLPILMCAYTLGFTIFSYAFFVITFAHRKFSQLAFIRQIKCSKNNQLSLSTKYPAIIPLNTINLCF